MQYRHWFTTAPALLLALAASRATAQERTEIVLADSTASPESLTSSADGAIYFGSTANGNIYRAAPGAARAEVWLAADVTGLTNVLGVLADDRRSTFWVCTNPSGGRGGAPARGQVAIRSFDLTTGRAKGTYPFPGGGLCNDMTVADDGTVYATDFTGARIMRLAPGDSTLTVWLTDSVRLARVDGISTLTDGTVIANSYSTGKLYRIPVAAGGAAGAMVELTTTVTFSRPDGLRRAGANTFLQAEGSGRLTALTIQGDRAEVRVLKEGMPNAPAVTLVGNTAWVLVGRMKAVSVPWDGR